MTLFPVIARELRASARHPFTYYVRVLGALALLVACLLFFLRYAFFERNLGSKLFGNLHFSLFWAIWVIVPLLAADCISRERREGTLGLLFLTRLTANDIVIAKGLAHGLRALTLGLAVVPVVTIPFLVGGVSWAEAMMSIVVNFSAICWALAAGLLASAWSKVWLRALLWAAVLGLISLLSLSFTVGSLLSGVSASGLARGRLSAEPVLFSGLAFLTNATWGWSSMIRLMAGGGLLWLAGQLVVSSLLVLALAIVIAGAKTSRVWQERPPSVQMLWWQKTFFTPVLWLSFFRRWMRRKLEHNPIGWLEQRTWRGRLVVWAWFAVMISVYSAILTDRYFFRGSNEIQSVMAWLLAGSMAMGAAGSFRRERETGVLELLLVSPLGEAEIIYGRLRGLWSQFLPAVGLLLGIWGYFSTLLPGGSVIGGLIFYAITFLTLPVIGLYFSLSCRNFITAFLATVFVGLLGPLVLKAFLGWIAWLYSGQGFFYSWNFGPGIGGALCQILLAVLCWRRLHSRLKRRAFPLEREV